MSQHKYNDKSMWRYNTYPSNQLLNKFACICVFTDCTAHTETVGAYLVRAIFSLALCRELNGSRINFSPFRVPSLNLNGMNKIFLENWYFCSTTSNLKSWHINVCIHTYFEILQHFTSHKNGKRKKKSFPVQNRILLIKQLQLWAILMCGFNPRKWISFVRNDVKREWLLFKIN